jgi:hypothetical protein
MGGVTAFGFIGIVLGPLAAVILEAILEGYYARSSDVAAAAEASYAGLVHSAAGTPAKPAVEVSRPVGPPRRPWGGVTSTT